MCRAQETPDYRNLVTGRAPACRVQPDRKGSPRVRNSEELVAQRRTSGDEIIDNRHQGSAAPSKAHLPKRQGHVIQVLPRGVEEATVHLIQ
jgi:hypothetical protein